jgi:hypothetical protein
MGRFRRQNLNDLSVEAPPFCFRLPLDRAIDRVRHVLQRDVHGTILEPRSYPTQAPDKSALAGANGVQLSLNVRSFRPRDRALSPSRRYSRNRDVGSGSNLCVSRSSCAACLRSPAGVAVAALFGTFALYSSISSSFIGDRDLRALVVRCRIGFWTLERIYPAESIDVVFVCRYRKGNGLRVRLRSGRCKTLTTFVDWLYDLESVAGALNHFLYTPHRGKQFRA